MYVVIFVPVFDKLHLKITYFMITNVHLHDQRTQVKEDKGMCWRCKQDIIILLLASIFMLSLEAKPGYSTQNTDPFTKFKLLEGFSGSFQPTLTSGYNTTLNIVGFKKHLYILNINQVKYILSKVSSV